MSYPPVYNRSSRNARHSAIKSGQTGDYNKLLNLHMTASYRKHLLNRLKNARADRSDIGKLLFEKQMHLWLDTPATRNGYHFPGIPRLVFQPLPKPDAARSAPLNNRRKKAVNWRKEKLPGIDTITMNNAFNRKRYNIDYFRLKPRENKAKLNSLFEKRKPSKSIKASRRPRAMSPSAQYRGSVRREKLSSA